MERAGSRFDSRPRLAYSVGERENSIFRRVRSGIFSCTAKSFRAASRRLVGQRLVIRCLTWSRRTASGPVGGISLLEV
jgi:hypothetical protein